MCYICLLPSFMSFLGGLDSIGGGEEDTLCVVMYSIVPLIRTPVIRISNYPDWFGPSCKFVKNSTQITCLEITGYRINYSIAIWLVELQIRRGRKFQTQVHTVNSNSRTANCQCSLFSKKNPIIRIFRISGCSAVPINPVKWRYTVLITSCL